MNLTIRILRARKGKRISQQAVAKMMGISRSALAQWESSVCNPSLKNLLKLSEVLDVSFEWLATGRGEPDEYRELTSDISDIHIEGEIVKSLRLLNSKKKRTILNVIKSMI